MDNQENSEQMLPLPNQRFQLTLTDRNSGNQVNSFLEVYSNEDSAVDSALKQGIEQLLKQLRGENMDNKEKEQVEKAEMDQDLAHHKTQETDVLVKAENPADDFMQQKDLDKETHGKAQ